MALNIGSSPHLQSNASVTRVMVTLLAALLPGLIAYVVFFGIGVLLQLALAVITAVVTEAAMLALRKRPIQPFLLDGSAVVTGVLLALAIPSLAPWWVIVIGTAFAIVVAKHLYGGLGYNPFNPAMVGYVMLLISFPVEMTQWPAAMSAIGHAITASEAVSAVFGVQSAGLAFDQLTMATPLDHLKTQLPQLGSVSAVVGDSPVFGPLSGQGFDWVAIGYLLGGVFLIARKIISWHIPVAFLGALGVMSGLFYLVDTAQFASPLFHWFAGASILGAFFIATDPVSASTTPRGKLIYGALIGLLVFVIRTWGGYPDAVAFAVLLMNMAVPLIDHYTQPRVFGY